MKTVLSLSGGGARGIVITRILERIEQVTGKAASELFDLFAGTSTGSIIAAGLCIPPQLGSGTAYRFTAGDILRLYQENLPAIFANPRSLYSILSGSRYDAGPLETVLSTVVGDYTLAEASKYLLISSFDTVRMQPILFKKTGQDAGTRIRDAVRASSAAPTFFPPHQLGDRSLIDGAIACLNNPSVAAYAYSREIFDEDEPIVLVSISCGEVRRSDELQAGYTYAETSGFGALGWVLSLTGSPLINMLMDASEKSAHQEMLSILPRDADRNLTRYYRLSVPLPAAVMSKLDDASASNLAYLISETDAWLNLPEVASNFRSLCGYLLANYELTNDSTAIISSSLTVSPPMDSNWYQIPDVAFTSSSVLNAHGPELARPDRVGFEGQPLAWLQISLPHAYELHQIIIYGAEFTGGFMTSFQVETDSGFVLNSDSSLRVFENNVLSGVLSLNPDVSGYDLTHSDVHLITPRSCTWVRIYSLSHMITNAFRLDFRGRYLR